MIPRPHLDSWKSHSRGSIGANHQSNERGTKVTKHVGQLGKEKFVETGCCQEKGRRGKEAFLRRHKANGRHESGIRIKTSECQNLKQPVLLKNDLALPDIALQVALVSPLSGNIHNPRFMFLITLLLSRLTAYFALVTFNTGVFTPALVLSLRVPYPQVCSHNLFSSPKNMCLRCLHITLFLVKSC